MKDVYIFNTLSGRKEAFKPLKTGRAGLYHCGPTVYDDAHIGNLRSYVFADILRRTLEYGGYSVDQVINVTDVGHLSSDADQGEDKMTKALKRLGKPMTLEAMDEAATIYFDRFVEDLKSLNIELPSSFPRASRYIESDIALIRILEEKGYAYKTRSGVCFDTSKFAGYGKLGGIDLGSIKEGARVAPDPDKRNPSDFFLWRSDPELGWDSPWGKGFPGWHIECSVMSRELLGQPFDIHTGGIDHIPVHHNDEIAQSEAAYGVPLADYWMHNAFLTMNNAKMAKSAGGFVTLRSLIGGGISPLAYRYWLLTGHYRSPMDFSYDAVNGAQNAYKRLLEAVAGYPEGGSMRSEHREAFEAFISDDLDTPKVIALAWDIVKDQAIPDADKRAALLCFDRVLGLRLDKATDIGIEDMPSEVRSLMEEREKAREDKDWKRADELRVKIESAGYRLKDGPKGTEIRPL